MFKCASMVNGYRIMHLKAFYGKYTEVAGQIFSASLVSEFG